MLVKEVMSMLEQLLLAKGKGVKQLAEELEVSPSTLYRLKQGHPVSPWLTRRIMYLYTGYLAPSYPEGFLERQRKEAQDD